MSDAQNLSVESGKTTAEQRLERGELLYYPIAPFALPNEEDRSFLLEQRVAGFGRKNITYNPHANRVVGFARQSNNQAERLARVLADYSRSLTAWLTDALPHYRGGIEPDRASFRPEEEATRRIRFNARNDLLHVDAFPNRPARGRRILRVFANLHPSEPHVWATSDALPQLLARFGKRIDRRNRSGWLQSLAATVRDLISPPDDRRTPADVYMLRLHDYLKRNLRLQQKGPRKLWRFPPGSAWMAMTDGCCHADLRGQFALEHSYFIAPEVLACPQLAPAALIGAA